MSKLEFKFDNSTPHYKIHITGTIDEDVNFAPYPLAGAQTVELWLGEIKNINSCGIREWIKWIAGSGKAVVKYHECPKVIVDQINMVQGFLPLGRGHVVSFFVPYFSDAKSEQKDVLYTFGKEYDDAGIKEPQVKDSDGNVMEVDVAKVKYFKFLNQAKKAA